MRGVGREARPIAGRGILMRSVEGKPPRATDVFNRDWSPSIVRRGETTYLAAHKATTCFQFALVAYLMSDPAQPIKDAVKESVDLARLIDGHLVRRDHRKGPFKSRDVARHACSSGTTTAHGRLIFTVFAGLAEFEHDLTRTRTSDDLKRAVVDGLVMGRNPELNPHQRREALARRAEGELLRDMHSTIADFADRRRGLSSSMPAWCVALRWHARAADGGFADPR